MKSKKTNYTAARYVAAILAVASIALLGGWNMRADDESAADKAWAELERARQPGSPPKEWYTKEPTKEEIQEHYAKQAVRATKAADMAKEFYEKYPDDKRAQEARTTEYHLLTAVVQLGDDSVSDRLKKLGSELLNDKSLPEDERVMMMLTAARDYIQNATEETLMESLSKASETIEKTMDEFPTNAMPAQFALQLAQIQKNVGDAGQAKKLYERVQSNDAYPEQLRQMAKSELGAFDRLGKPIEFAFTAVDGREVEMNKFKGKVVLVDFWATWCGPCMAGLPELLETYEKFHDKGFEIVGINADEKVEDLNKVVKERGIRWPQFFDSENDSNRIVEKFGIGAFPTLWLVGKDGNLRYLNARMDLQGKVEKLLAEASPADTKSAH